MKYLLSALLAIIWLNVSAQPGRQEIKKLKISKITKLSTTTDGVEPEKQENYYDRSGNDTAYYIGGILIIRSVYSFDRMGRPMKVTSFNAEGKETETALYSYQPDGSHKISSTDKTYGMTDYEWYDKAGKLTKTQSPDGAQRLYTYNAKGKLVSVKTKVGSNGGTIVDLKYSYNSKGQCYKEVSNGEFRWVKTFLYDEKGLLIKTKIIASDEGVETETIGRYEYEFWK